MTNVRKNSAKLTREDLKTVPKSLQWNVRNLQFYANFLSEIPW